MKLFQFLFSLMILYTAIGYAEYTPTPIDDSINLKDFLKPKAKGEDDTQAFLEAARAVDASYRQTDTESGAPILRSRELYIPHGSYIIHETINFVSPVITIRSEGGATIQQTGNIPTFQFGATTDYGSQKVKIHGLKFLQGSNQLYFTNKNPNAVMIKIEDSEFWESSDYAIKTIGKEGDFHLSAMLTVENSKFMNVAGVLENYCDQAIIRDTWVQVAAPTLKPNTAVFYNRSGTLTLDQMLGVPGIADPLGKDRVAGVHWVKLTGGNLYALRSRFGGEGAGYPIVSFDWEGNSGSMRGSANVFPHMGPSIVIENSQISAGARQTPDAAVININSRIPHLIRLVGNNYLLRAPYLRLNNPKNTEAYINNIPHSIKKEQLFKITIEPNMAILPDGSLPSLLLPLIQK